MIDTLIQIVLVAVSQMLLVFFKHVNIRVIVAKQVVKSMLYTFFIQASWLVSSAIGINAMVQGDWVVVTFYLLGGVFGTYLNFKILV